MIHVGIFTAKCLVGKLAVVHGGHCWEDSRRKVWKRTFILSYVCLYFMNFCTVGLTHLLHQLCKLKDGGAVEAWRGRAGQQGSLTGRCRGTAEHGAGPPLPCGTMPTSQQGGELTGTTAQLELLASFPDNIFLILYTCCSYCF